MTAIEQLVAEMRDHGVQVIPDHGELQLRAATPPPDDLLERVRRSKRELLEWLAKPEQRSPERAFASGPLEERDALWRLVEEMGRLEQLFCSQRVHWTAEEHDRQWILLRAAHAEVDRRLAETGSTHEEFGWTVTADGRWRRVGEEPPTVERTAAELLLQRTYNRAAALWSDCDELEALEPMLTAVGADLGETGRSGDLKRLQVLCEEYLAIIRGGAVGKVKARMAA